MNAADAKRLLETDPDWINSKRFENSLDKLLERYPEGAPAKVAAQALMMSEEELLELEAQLIQKIRAGLGL